MVLRNLKSDFIGGAYVFPGGAVDPDDAGATVLARCVGLDDAAASTALALEVGGISYYVACVRELFEEAGLLLAHREDGGPIDPSDAGLLARLADRRRQMNDGEGTLASMLEDERLVLDLTTLHYFAHWITPVGPPRRYDTRFFVGAAPVGQVPLHDDRELVAHTWVTPDEALERHRNGEMQLILPTIKNLEAVARFATSRELLDAVERRPEVPTIEPRIVRDGDGVRILLPGDEGFDDRSGLPDALVAERSVRNEDIAQASNDLRAP